MKLLNFCLLTVLTPFLQRACSVYIILLQMQNGAAGLHGLTARALVGKVDRAELAPAATKPRDNLSGMAGALENRSRKNRVLTGNVQVHSLIEDHYTSWLLFLNNSREV